MAVRFSANWSVIDSIFRFADSRCFAEHVAGTSTRSIKMLWALQELKISCRLKLQTQSKWDGGDRVHTWPSLRFSHTRGALSIVLWRSWKKTDPNELWLVDFTKCSEHLSLVFENKFRCQILQIWQKGHLISLSEADPLAAQRRALRHWSERMCSAFA